MPIIHFLNVLEGDCNIIQHDNGRVSMLDVSNAYDDNYTPAELAVRSSNDRAIMVSRTGVPSGKKDYHQKKDPDNPIKYLNKLKISSIFRFILTHPDMDHMDGIKDLFNNFKVQNFWFTKNKKELQSGGGAYNSEDWDFYKGLRDGNNNSVLTHNFLSKVTAQYYSDDHIHIIAPSENLVNERIRTNDYNDSSYVLLYTPPKANGKQWKVLFAGDSSDKTWEYILNDPLLAEQVSNVDILFAPHHGRDSGRDYGFLKIVNPTITLFGNASSAHLAYTCYPETRITNNQAGYVIMKITDDKIYFYVKNEEFANDYRRNPKRGWGNSTYSNELDAYFVFNIS